LGRDFTGTLFMATGTPTDFRQHLEVETPEHVVLDYEIAGLGSRALAAIIDSLVLICWSMALVAVFGVLALQLEQWAGAIFTLVYFASLGVTTPFSKGCETARLRASGDSASAWYAIPGTPSPSAPRRFATCFGPPIFFPHPT
jgi:hypothetical protein